MKTARVVFFPEVIEDEVEGRLNNILKTIPFENLKSVDIKPSSSRPQYQCYSILICYAGVSK